MSIPLSSSNLSMIGPTSSSLRPEYTTSPSPETSPPPEAEPPADAEPPPEVVSPPDAEPPSEAEPPPDSSCPPHPTTASDTNTKKANIPHGLFQDRTKLLLSDVAPELIRGLASRPLGGGLPLMIIIC